MGLTRLRAEQISDIDYKQAVRAITVTDIADLASGAPSQVDGVNLSVDDRILVTAQDPGSENGIYQVETVGTGSNGTWIRSTDTNATGELEAGTIVMVTEGNTYADTQWKLTTNNPIVIGTTPLTFEQNSAYAFGNIYANGTAVLANSVGSTVTFAPGSGIQILGNNTTKTVTILATGTSTAESISNGTSNVTVVSSGGNITMGVGGTGNIAEFSTQGLSITGNITGSYIFGNGSQLTGVNAGLKWTTVANTAPSGANPGDFWYDSYTSVKYQYTNDGTSNVWIDQSYPTNFSTLTVNNIVNGSGNGTGNIGSSGGYFNTVFAKATSAQYADLAEMYVADHDYPAGTVVEFGGEFEITATTETHSTRIAGIVSTNPSYLMNSAQSGIHVLPIALTGRVPCKVVGTIRKGDRLVSGSIPGVATPMDNRLYEPGCIIGKALENYDSIADGIIEVAVGRD